jgi:hypothetical protein
MSEHDADMLLQRIREIMEETKEPFAPAVSIYIREKYGDKRDKHED